ncbi:MAG TPA: sigma-54 dependent transcriptional regulator [Gammaproteobacteria bacterium]
MVWVTSGADAKDWSRALHGKWRLHRIRLASEQQIPDLHAFRVGVIDIDGPIPKRVIDWLRANQHIKWIALIPEGTPSHDELRYLVEGFCFDVHGAPMDDTRLKVTLDRAFRAARLEAHSRRMELERQCIDGVPMIGASAAMLELRRLLIRAAASDAPVVLQGENGTGKELAARMLHRHSARSARPFVVIHCGALPSQLIQSELFGYEAGAFPAANARKLGRLELANGGTVVLDDVDKLGFEMQVDLLAFLRNGTFWRVGGLEPISADVRVIATTTVDLSSAIAERRFREDLYYRLNVIHVNVPPLRERGADVMRLARHFLKRHCSPCRFTRASVEAMLRYDWPGNVRELINCVQRAATVTDGLLIQPKHLGLTHAAGAQKRQPTLAEARARAEREAIQEALRQSAHNVARAARQLGIGRVTLYRLMGKHGISLQRQY